MADSDSIRKRIISSVFNRRNASGDSNETYVSHVKIWEDAGSEADLKPRYILLARTLRPLLRVNGIAIVSSRKP
jgi:exocyst complex component 1